MAPPLRVMKSHAARSARRFDWRYGIDVGLFGVEPDGLVADAGSVACASGGVAVVAADVITTRLTPALRRRARARAACRLWREWQRSASPEPSLPSGEATCST